MNEIAETDWRVRHAVYDVTLSRGYPPTIAELSTKLGLPRVETQAALQRLAAGRILVLQADTSEILMVSPFSAVPTSFLVETASFSCFGNCIWDALGIPVMLKQDARIKAGCGDCGTALELSVVNGQLQDNPGIVHFAIPAHHWWDDIVFS